MNRTVQILTGIWVAGVTVAAFLWLPPAEGFRSPEAARIVVFHVPCAMLTFVAFLVNAVYSWKYLRSRDPLTDSKANAAAELGMLFAILATVTGSLFAMEQWGSAWNWDPRETSIVMLMLVYAAYFVLRGAVEEKSKRARLSAAYALLAFPAMVFLIWILPRIVEIAAPDKHAVLSLGVGPQVSDYSVEFLRGVVGGFRLDVSAEIAGGNRGGSPAQATSPRHNA
jgi:heme exporter protein C